jgi:hypothetical protein
VLDEHPSVHFPAAHFSFTPHCDWSKHWFDGVVHTPPLPLLPATQRLPLVQLASESQVFAVGEAQVPSG